MPSACNLNGGLWSPPAVQARGYSSQAASNLSTYNYHMGITANWRRRRIESGQAGFTLTELAMVLVIVALLIVFLMPTSTALLNNQKRELTRQKLKVIDAALTNYVALNKRLPCPADGSVVSGSVGAGSEGGRTNDDCTNAQVSGVVPWVTIGLAEADIEDGWYRRITYRAAFSLTRDNVLDMTLCDPAGTGAADTTTATTYAAPGGRCLTGCVATPMTSCTAPTNYLVGKGFDIRDGAGTTLIMDKSAYTGAAYVLISHGENGYGAYDNSGLYIATAAVGVQGDIETVNINALAASVTVATTFRDAGFSEGAAATYFDDLLVRPSVFTVIQRTQLGPRSH